MLPYVFLIGDILKVGYKRWSQDKWQWVSLLLFQPILANITRSWILTSLSCTNYDFFNVLHSNFFSKGTVWMPWVDPYSLLKMDQLKKRVWIDSNLNRLNKRVLIKEIFLIRCPKISGQTLQSWDVPGQNHLQKNPKNSKQTF